MDGLASQGMEGEGAGAQAASGRSHSQPPPMAAPPLALAARLAAAAVASQRPPGEGMSSARSSARIVAPEEATESRTSAKRARTGTFEAELPLSARVDVFDSGEAVGGRLYIGAQTATVEWRIEDFAAQRQRADGACLDGPKFGLREPWQIFCHPDGRCFNQPQGGPPGVFLRYLGPHERVPAYATIEKLTDGKFQVPENNARDAPFVVLFGRNEIEEWGVCKDFGLFDDAFGRSLNDDGALVLRGRVAWIDPRSDSLLPNEVVSPGRFAASCLAGVDASLQADLGALWAARRPVGAGPSGGPAGDGPVAGVPGDVVLICEQQRFEADRAILATRSAFFRAMFASFKEAEQREVELPDTSARALAATLRFIYTDEGPEIRSIEEAEELLTSSSKFGIPGLMQICSDVLRDRWLTVASAVGLLRLADEHGARSLRAEALAVIGANFDQLKMTTEWDDLLRTGMNPALIQDTLQAVQDASIFAGRASIKL